MNSPKRETPACTIRITPVGWRDLRAVVALQRASFRPGLRYGWGILITMRAMPFVTFVVARNADDRIVGCLIADRDRLHKCIRVMNVAVHPDARRQGIGRALMTDLETRLPGPRIVLMVDEMNRAAQSLYLALGYVRTGYQRDYYGRGNPGIEMTRTLP